MEAIAFAQDHKLFIYEETLTDGSKVYDVAMKVGVKGTLIINCSNEESAENLFNILSDQKLYSF